MSSERSDEAVLPELSRDRWRKARLEMEQREARDAPPGLRLVRHWNAFKTLVGLFGIGLRLLGIYDRGVRNALDIEFNRLEFWFEDLPREFDGFRLLQLTDLHADFLPETMEIMHGLIEGIEADLCVLTGDYRGRVSGPFDQIMPTIGRIASQISAPDGIFAILGNHDCADMAEAFEVLGITVLINQTRTIRRGQAAIHFTGTDDVHYYYTDAARASLARAPEGFRVALIHSAELADAAAESGFHLYLAGHTHGGQICLPGGRPIISGLSRYRRYASGLWRHGSMVGYTSTGVGVSALPVRFNSRGEVVMITLRAGAPPPGQSAA